MHLKEVYDLVCCSCAHKIEVPVVGPHVCPFCNAPLTIEWDASHKPTASPRLVVDSPDQSEAEA